MTTPIIVTLESDGVRLRFDGAGQKLRLIEVVNFASSIFTYNGHEIYRPEQATQSPGSPPPGIHYRAVAKLFGPTFPPEYIPPTSGTTTSGACILSYPGIAFSFPITSSSKSATDAAELLTTSAARPASSLSIFRGRSWAEVRSTLFAPPQTPGHLSTPSKRQRTSSSSAQTSGTAAARDGITSVKIYGQGRIQLTRSAEATSQPINIVLSETTPQDLISDLGPPDAIYHKSDRRLSIHQQSHSRARRDDADEDGEATFEHFYNYFRYGFDVLISTAAAPSPASPSMPEALLAQFVKLADGSGAPSVTQIPRSGANGPVATKLLLHANVPGSYDFGRYARCPWTLEHVPSAKDAEPLTSEMKFDKISARLRDVWGGTASSDREEGAGTRGMLLQRGWMSEDVDVGFGLGGSAEVVGHEAWEEGDGRSGGETDVMDGGDEAEGETTQLFGFPGLVFEVLKNGVVGCLTVY